ncbi:hypothetical protein LTS18_007694 [Coniosporium uncinatum]|uniref:Uncharacterized protein n=1 Tax=Coniosporium uncinatum TaxID=93489 RepID=A0ACC3D2Q8_9PEZI|nr:hypothetical protein LTS18_007694 [Coniosporium uncinatum]
MKLESERKRHKEREKHLHVQMKDMKERLRQAMGENMRMSTEIALMRKQMEEKAEKGEKQPVLERKDSLKPEEDHSQAPSSLITVSPAMGVAINRASSPTEPAITQETQPANIPTEKAPLPKRTRPSRDRAHSPPDDLPSELLFSDLQLDHTKPTPDSRARAGTIAQHTERKPHPTRTTPKTNRSKDSLLQPRNTNTLHTPEKRSKASPTPSSPMTAQKDKESASIIHFPATKARVDTFAALTASEKNSTSQDQENARMTNHKKEPSHGDLSTMKPPAEDRYASADLPAERLAKARARLAARREGKENQAGA